MKSYTHIAWKYKKHGNTIQAIKAVMDTARKRGHKSLGNLAAAKFFVERVTWWICNDKGGVAVGLADVKFIC